MATLNKVMLMGRMIDNPEPPRTLPNSGSTVVKFRFAVGKSRKNPQTGQWENDPNPLYIDCEAFARPETKRNLCDLITQYLRKGDPVYLEGRLQLDTWEDKNGGGKRSKHKLVVENLEFLGGNKGGGDEGGSMNRGVSNNQPMTSRGGYSSPHDDIDDSPSAGPGGGRDSDIPF